MSIGASQTILIDTSSMGTVSFGMKQFHEALDWGRRGYVSPLFDELQAGTITIQSLDGTTTIRNTVLTPWTPETPQTCLCYGDGTSCLTANQVLYRDATTTVLLSDASVGDSILLRDGTMAITGLMGKTAFDLSVYDLVTDASNYTLETGLIVKA